MKYRISILSLFLSALLLCSCAVPGPAQSGDPIQITLAQTTTLPIPSQSLPEETEPSEQTLPVPLDPVMGQVEQMSLEELVGQLFLVSCPDYGAAEEISRYRFGGVVLFSRDFEGQTPVSVRDRIDGLQAASAIPLLIAVDEEGGSVTRVSSEPGMRPEPFPSPRSLYEQGGARLVLETEAEKSELLRTLGINVNLSPVADICDDPAAFMYSRSLGLNPKETADMICQMIQVMAQQRIGSVIKHFPGYGNNTDTHVAMANDYRSLEELEKRDLIPFRAAAELGCGAIMVSHTVIHALDSTLPASLSPAVHQYLRYDMGYDGVIMTDNLTMQAVSDHFGMGEAAVLAVLAGSDILCTEAYAEPYEAVLQAAREGRIPLLQLQQSAARILRWKAQLNQTQQFT